MELIRKMDTIYRRSWPLTSQVLSLPIATQRASAIGLVSLSLIMTTPVQAESVTTKSKLFIAYPPAQHQTTANRIFLLGTAPPEGDVLINGEPIANRSRSGHFAPSVPLAIGENIVKVRYQNQELTLKITRLSSQAELPPTLGFAPGSLSPAVDVVKRPGDLLCFGAIARPNATVSVSLAGVTIPLLSKSQIVNLPDNKAVLTNTNLPINQTDNNSSYYYGCAQATQAGELGKPIFQLSLDGQTMSETSPGKITILAPTQFSIAEVIVLSAIARTGPSTDHSRLTPLPKGTKAAIVGQEGEWLKLDYGAWIKASEAKVYTDSMPPKSIIRSVSSRQVGDWTEIYFPLEVAVPVSVQQGDGVFTLSVYNTTAQTDTIRFDENPVISRLDWQQSSPDRIDYIFNLTTSQQWGYKLRYEGTTLVLSLRHPPQLQNENKSSDRPLTGMKILIDPGHGGPEDGGGIGPTGYREKDVALIISKLVQQELTKRGATVVMTRESDIDLDLQPRIDIINKEEASIAISLHYNALPDNGDAVNTAGIGAFWYHPQAHSLALFLHNYLVEKLNRPSYGIFWNNLALTRPTNGPSVLMELGFMINPEEFEWIVDDQAQGELAEAIAQGITEWLYSNSVVSNSGTSNSAP